MPVRTQVYLGEQQVRRLKARAEQLHTTVSDLVRQGVELIIEAGREDFASDPLLGLIGKADAGRDASRSVDKVLYGKK